MLIKQWFSFSETLHLSLIHSVFSAIGELVKQAFNLFQIVSEIDEQNSDRHVTEIFLPNWTNTYSLNTYARH